MKKQLTHDSLNKVLWDNGYFYGLKILLNEYDVSVAQAIKIKAGLYKLLSRKVLEGKKEIQHLQNAVARLESACRAGTSPNPQTARQAFDNNNRALQQALQAFDGWTISLLETNTSLLWTVHNPETAGIRINKLKESFANLTYSRAPGYNLLSNFPELFDLRVSVR